LVEVFREDAGRQHEASHPVVAAILHHIASRIANSKSLAELTTALTEGAELAKWLPHEPQDHIVSHARAVVAIAQQGFDPETHNQAMALLQIPGRTGNSRGVAAWALELHNQRQRWPDIEARLLPHRRNAKNPGESVRREVQLLKVALRRYGVLFEPG
jgi:hypothetical protein